MFGLGGLKLYGAIAGAVMFLLFAAWVWRIDSLRSQYKRDFATCQQNFAQFQADVVAKTELARREDLAHKTEVERQDAQLSKESDNDIRQKIAAAVAAARSRVRPAPPARIGGGGNPPVSRAAAPAADPAGAGQTAIVPAADLTTCATNTILSEGWQSWYKQVQAVPR